ncbi:protein Aster-B-like isoform X1 [Schistocerca piceifrons]|uniref:protein Aster-B-like isoform X1 n=1 Tax=Schistocerca piceifrons TaxID=274613 RepID=UPI001F5E4053|nr:protein Aster-B-like isoform X1 [Schistocerca piceifrons]XP_049783346.1 protein Aster-B-like isoform X1 [Schistocerca cancellata]
MNDTDTCCSAATIINEEQHYEEQTSHEPPERRRKSVENLLISSHDVIGSSISSSLTFNTMTLPSACHVANPNGSLEPRSPSPSTSPQSSPRPSPRQQHKRDHSKGDIILTGNSSTTVEKPDTFEDSISRSSDSSQVADLTRSISHDSSKERKESRGSDRSKKKSSWYNVLYPTYKSRSEDFKRLFKDVPQEERLIVDYSCALQKDIIVHGRLYVSPNYLCFYANIFRWETQLSLRWKDITAITKEKTALVIPNAILVCTKTEKHFLTSFGARDKTYLMLFRVWQNALLDQQLSMQEIWQWVHTCYGDELGLTSDDEDYIAPVSEEEKQSSAAVRLSVDSFAEECYGVIEQPVDSLLMEEDQQENIDPEIARMNQINTPGSSPGQHGIMPDKSASTLASADLPTDMSDTTESDVEKTAGKLPKTTCGVSFQMYKKSAAVCTSPHEGRRLVRIILPIHVDQLFTLLFTGSKFLLDFHTQRKTTDIVLAPWQADSETGMKHRTISMTVSLSQSMGPKTSQVTENQMMRKCSKPGELYSIDIESSNAGIPYADSFGVNMHYCLTRTGENESCFTVFAQLKYKRNVWGFVKGFIEKNTWAGLDDFYGSLAKALQVECDHDNISKKKTTRRRRRGATVGPNLLEDSTPRLGHPLTRPYLNDGRSSGPDFLAWTLVVVLTVLVFLNGLLYCKLWMLEEWTQHTDHPFSVMDLQVMRNPPKSHEEWLRLLQQQEILHNVEMQKWQKVLQAAVQLLRQSEESLSELQVSINPLVSKKVLSILKESVAEEETTSNKNVEQTVKYPQQTVNIVPRNAGENQEL